MCNTEKHLLDPYKPFDFFPLFTPVVQYFYVKYTKTDISTLLPNISPEVYQNSYQYIVDKNFGFTVGTTITETYTV